MTASERVTRAIDARRERVNDAIPDALPIDEPERLYRATRHLLDAGGKRLRPAVFLLAAEAVAEVPPLDRDYRAFPALDGDTFDVLAGALSIEVIHLFTLIHDDIMDDDDLRRGAPAVHRAFDEETAILAGDTLYSKAFEILLDAGAPDDRTVRALRMVAETCTRICEGQAIDIAFERRRDVTVEEYHEMIERKTAVLFAAAAGLPAVLLGADRGTVDALYGYGIDVGRAFQIHDDVLDLTRSSDVLGKRRGSDLVEHKQTLITVHARREGVDVEALLPGDDPTDAEIDVAVETLDAAGSIDHARDAARDLVDRGQARLDALPETEARELLRELAGYLVEREY